MNRTVWITGAGSGIGRALARGFADAGDRIAMTGRTRDSLEETAASLPSGTASMIVPGDVTDRDAMATAAREIAAWGDGLHVLCNNAGLNIPKRRWAELDWESWDRVIDINVTGALNVIAACLPIMRAQHEGLMIHTGSWAGRYHSQAGGVIYGASKHALSDLSASLNDEEGANGIRSTVLCPAEVATPLLARRPGFDSARMDDVIQPDDLAETALYVANMSPKVVVAEIVLAPISA